MIGPSFGALSWGPPHNPYHTAPEQYRQLYRVESITAPANVTDAMVAEAQENLAGYHAHCSALDACFGRLLAALDANGLADNTIVIFTSDHGDMLGSHHLYEKQGPWEESVRIPFLLRDPCSGVTGESDVLIDMPDIFPTLCGFAGLQAPETVQGRDLSAALQAGSVPADDCAFLASYHIFGTWQHMARKYQAPALYHEREYRGVRTRQYTYTEDLVGPWLLYDNLDDPCQMHNLVDNPAWQPLRESLATRLRHRRDILNDAFHPGSEYVRAWGYEICQGGAISTPGWKG